MHLVLPTWLADPAFQSVLLVPLLLVLLNVASGVAAAIRMGHFNAGRLSDFLRDSVPQAAMAIVSACAVGYSLHWSLSQIVLANHGVLLAFYASELSSIDQNLHTLLKGWYSFRSFPLVQSLLAGLFPKAVIADVPSPLDVAPQGMAPAAPDPLAEPAPAAAALAADAPTPAAPVA